MFHNWAAALPPHVQVCAVQLPGRDTQMRVAPYTSAVALADLLAGAIEPYLDLPYALFGHSMGGLIAFELARQLRRRNKPAPSHFFVSACRAAQKPVRRTLLHTLPQEAFIRELRQRYNGIPDTILREPELLQMFLPVLRADFELVETYRDAGGDPFDFPITAYGGATDTEILQEDLEGWQHQTTAPFRLRMFHGDHFYINTNRPALLQELRQALA